jgi:NADH-quinone oxidoreductase subunit G
VLILGEIAENHGDASHIRAAAKALQQAGKASICRLPQGANAIGLAQHGVLPGESGRHADAMLNGDLKSMLLFGIEPQFDFSDTTRAVKALVGAKVVACSAYVTESLKELADVILPIGLLPEIQATLTNVDGRDQYAEAAGKLPGSAQSGWRVLRALYDAAALPVLNFTDIDGLRSGLTKQTVAFGVGLSPKHAVCDGFERISTSPIYRGDAVTRRAASLQAHPLNTGPRLVMHPAAAAKAGLQEGQIAKVGDGTGSATLPVVLSCMIPESCVWIETNHPATAPLSQTASLTIVGAAL